MRIKANTIEILNLFYRKFRSVCWDIIGKFRNSITISTQQGIFTVLLTDSIISKSLFCNGQFELDLIKATMRFLREIQKCPPKGEGTILDIGANNGVISIGALHTGEMGRAIAIEPDPQNFLLLQRNVDQNGLKDKVICLPFGASHQKGELLFELSETNFGDHRIHVSPNLINSAPELDHESKRRVITIQADQVDTLLAGLPETATRNISLVWIDVQGYEGFVFTGARKLFSTGVPVNCEIWPYGIKRAGMSRERFCGIAKSIWSHYCVMRRGRFVQYPIHMLDFLFDELGYDYDGFTNVLFISQD